VGSKLFHYNSIIPELGPFGKYLLWEENMLLSGFKTTVVLCRTFFEASCQKAMIDDAQITLKVCET